MEKNYTPPTPTELPATQPRRQRWRVAWIVITIGLALLIGAASASWYFLKMRARSPVPEAVRTQLNFATLLPTKTYAPLLDDKSFSYDASGKVLTFTLTTSDCACVVTEQASPETFQDIPEYFDKLVASMQEYKRIETDVGTVSITRPKELKGKQVAVMNAKGTLLFMKSDREVSEDTWRKIFNDIGVVK